VGVVSVQRVLVFVSIRVWMGLRGPPSQEILRQIFEVSISQNMTLIVGIWEPTGGGSTFDLPQDATRDSFQRGRRRLDEPFRKRADGSRVVLQIEQI